MKVNCTPESSMIFEKFSQIASIPHCSGNTKAISDFCVNEAKRHNCKYIQDTYNNVIIYVDGTAGYENSKPVILQGHLDMVGVKTDECEYDLSVDPIMIRTDGEYIYADNTSLGADDGIAVAYMLTLLDDKTIAHPPLELVFTSDEEVGLVGVRYLKPEMFHTNRVINIDSEEEGILTVSCAGGVRANCSIPISFTDAVGEYFKISISGLIGGHSGTEINAGRLNANKLISRILNYIRYKVDFKLVSVSGGTKNNVIANDAKACICVKEENINAFRDAWLEITDIVARETALTEPDLVIELDKTEKTDRCMDEVSTERIIFAIMNIPNGVMDMSPNIEDMVQTSLNLGVVKTEEESVSFNLLLRSNIASGKQDLMLKLKSFTEFISGEVKFEFDYPAWEYRESSDIRDTMIKSYREVFGGEPDVLAIHAGLECGILAGIIEDMDAISFGPNILNAHTPQEKMEISSVARNWEFLKNVLKNLK